MKDQEAIDREYHDGRTVKIHDEAGFEGMRRAGRLAAQTLDFITPYVATLGEVIDMVRHQSRRRAHRD